MTTAAEPSKSVASLWEFSECEPDAERRFVGSSMVSRALDSGQWVVVPQLGQGTFPWIRGQAKNRTMAKVFADLWAIEHASQMNWALPASDVFSVDRLKCDYWSFLAVKSGDKTYEVRVDDRNFRRGGVLRLQQTAPGDRSTFTGEELVAQVTYKTEAGEFGLPEKLCVLGIRLLEGSQEK